MGNNPTKKPTKRKKPTDKQRNNSGVENLTPWKKGQSGNPKGRPRHDKCITDLLKLKGDEIKKDGRTKLQAVIETLYARAQEGDLKAIDMIFDRVEGKPAQKLEVEQDILPTGFDIGLIKN